MSGAFGPERVGGAIVERGTQPDSRRVHILKQDSTIALCGVEGVTSRFRAPIYLPYKACPKCKESR